ncbi:hypothetical protein IAG44_23900 [Streptomyces roseirectus]|uniref:Uncharacterized protein n=1 Tax=Streptomyces roseirectus TaxID=2768066 RepID=A0A7H0IH89_9ACTN|nr:hypothetical protein [Streptomyces roseirectus]QNP72155.1 hypothetical protein IAG44_23900 [Streptomyces roseirectus]
MSEDTPTPALRARLAASYEAYVLSDLARAAVPIPVAAGTPGALLTEAAGVLAAAHRLLDAAVVHERLAGAGWDLVGAVLGISPRAARVRFALAEAAFHEQLRPLGALDTARTAQLPPYVLQEPLEAALDLDDWVLRHTDGDTPGTTPVSGALLRTPRQPEGPG